MDGTPFAPTRLLLSGRVPGGSFGGVAAHGVPQSGAETGRPPTQAALQGVSRLPEAPGEATFARLSLLLPPSLPWPRLPAVTRDSPPASRAAARGRGGPERPRPPPRSPDQSRPSEEVGEGALAPASPQPPSPRARAAPAARLLPRRGHVAARGAWRPRPPPGRLPRARRAPQPPRAEPGRRAPRPAPARAPAPSPPPPRAPPLAPLPRPTSSAQPRGLSPQPPPTPPPPRLGLGAGSGRCRDSCAGEHRQAVSSLSLRVCVRVRLPPAGPAARGSGRPPAPPPPRPPGLPWRVPAVSGLGRPAGVGAVGSPRVCASATPGLRHRGSGRGDGERPRREWRGGGGAGVPGGLPVLSPRNGGERGEGKEPLGFLRRLEGGGGGGGGVRCGHPLVFSAGMAAGRGRGGPPPRRAPPGWRGWGGRGGTCPASHNEEGGGWGRAGVEVSGLAGGFSRRGC